MARTIAAVVLSLCFSGALWAGDEVSVFTGLITANNVDVTADDGSLLPERLNVGDSVYMLEGSKLKKKGWARVSKSPDDKVGIGWVESKNIRSFQRWVPPTEEMSVSPAEKTGEKTVFAPDFEEAKFGEVGVFPFVMADPDDPLGKTVFDLFVMSLRSGGKVKLSEDKFSGEKIDIESTEDLKRIVQAHKVDGIFVGKLSGDVAGARLLQVKFFGKDRDAFVLEKVKRLPAEGNLKSVIDSLVADCAAILTKK